MEVQLKNLSLQTYQKALLLWCTDDPRSLLELSIHKTRAKHTNKRKEFLLTKEETEYITKIGLIKIRDDVVEYVNRCIKHPRPLEKLEYCDNHPIYPAKLATGLCCRKCMSECYKTKEWAILTDAQEHKFVLVIMKWITKQCL